MRLFLLCVCLFFATIGAKAQWTTVDFIPFNGTAYESNVSTGGSAYWDLAANPTAGPRNGLINGTWEVTNTGLGATQSPSDAAGGRFLMYWSDQDYTGTTPAAAAGDVWSKTYTGLTIGKTYRYSFLSGYLICPSCVAPGGASLPSLKVRLDGVQVLSLPTMVASWRSTTYTFVATSTSHRLSIYNTNANPVGNDFGIDDIKLEILNPVALPVKVTSFAGVKTSDCGTKLSWQTATEINSDYFEIQKSSDGEKFTVAGTVKSNNNASGSSYQFYDTESESQKMYYRLAAVDLDGQITYSDIISVNSCINNKINIYPNPATDKINIADLHIGDMIQVVNMNGQVMMTQKAVQKNESLNTDLLPAGLYTVAVTDGKTGERKMGKVVKR